MRFLYVLFLLVGLVALAASGYLYLSWQGDNRLLRTYAADVLDGGAITGKKIELLNDKVYHTKGFGKSQRYFLAKGLGPTPVDILDTGGDCSDKSRLVASILNEYGVKATLVMLYPCATCPAGHTVVEAQAEDGPIVVDPVYNISFPDHGGGYHGLRSLRADPGILQNRLDELIALRGKRDKIAYFRRNADGIHYAHPRTVNWDKNGTTRVVKRALGLFVDDPLLVYRPRFMEDPKLLVLIAALTLGVLATGAGALGLWLSRNRS
ncbi:MAG: hypothetical protein H6906_13005 [Hyphomicrobiales bacterium]|nr:hypothetical protein [Hyphomicrobiales bacterium]